MISTQVTAGSRIYLLNIQKREARGPLIALGAAGKNLVRGAFGGRFDLHVRVEKAEKPPVVCAFRERVALPEVGPWTPPEAAARARGQGRGRGGGAAKPLTGPAAKAAYYDAWRKRRVTARPPLAPKSLNVQKDRRALATAAAALKKEIDADQTAMWRAKAQLTKKKEDLDRLEKTLAAMDDGAY